jgi:hypothetical protein
MKISNIVIAVFILSNYTLLFCEEEDIFASADIVPNTPPVVKKAPGYVPPEPLIIPLKVPFLGTINFKMEENKNIEGTFADKDQKKVVGPLILDNIKAILTADNKLKITGRATLFDKQAMIGLKESDLDKGYYVIGLTYIDKPKLELIPGTPFIIDATDVVLEKGQPVKIKAYTQIGKKQVILALTVKEKQTDLSAETDTLSLADLIPQLKDTPLNDIQLSTVKFEFLDMFNKSPKKGFAISANAAIAKPLIPDVTMQAMTFSLVVKKLVTEVTIDIPTCSIEKLGTVTNAKIKTTLEKDKKPTVLFSGDCAASLGEIGQMQLALSTELKAGNTSITGTLTKPFTIAEFTIELAQMNYNGQDKSIAVTGVTQAFGYKGSFSYNQPATGPTKIQVAISEKEIKPFSKIPGLDHITITSPAITIEKTKEGTYQGAITGLLNGAAVRLTRTKNEALCTIDHLKLSELMPAAQVTKKIDLALTAITITAKDLDLAGKTPVVTFAATMPLIGPFEDVAKLTKATTAQLAGTVAQGGKEVFCSAQIPGAMEFGPIAKITNLTVKFALAPAVKPILSVEHGLALTLPPTNDTLLFDSKLTLVNYVGTLNGTMKKDWTNPFGLAGLKISNGLIKASVNFATSKLTDIALEGDISASPVAGRVGVQVKGDITSDKYSFVITIPPTLSLAKVPGLKVLDGITIADPKIVYSSWDYEDKDIAMAVKKGLNFTGRVQMVGPLIAIGAFTKVKEAVITGAIPTDGTGGSFSASVPGELNFGTVMSVKNFKFVLSQDAGKLSYALENELSYKVPLTDAPLVFASKLNVDGDIVSLEGAMKGDWTNPFGMPGFKISNAGIKATYTMSTNKLNNVAIEGDMSLGTGPGSGRIGIQIQVKGDLTTEQYSYVIISLPTLAVASKLPGLKVLDGLSITDPKIVYSNWDYDDKEMAMAVKKGLNYVGKIQLTGPLASIGSFTGAKEVIISGAIPTDGTGGAFGASIPGELKFGNVISIKNFKLRLSLIAGKSSYALENELSCTMPFQKMPLVFASKLSVDGDTGLLEGAMKGDWTDPFGIPGVKISNPAIKATYSLSTNKLTNIAFDGDITADSIAAKVGVKVKGDVNSDQHSYVVALPPNSAVASKLPGLKVLNGLAVSDPKIVYSFWDYEDKEEGMSVKKGLNFAGKLQLVGPLAPVASLTKAKEVVLAGVVPTESTGSTGASLSAYIPGQISFGNTVVLKNLKLSLGFSQTGAPVYVLEHELVLNLDLPMSKTASLMFDAKLSFVGDKGIIEGALKGSWDPLGVPELSLNNPRVKATLDIKTNKITDISIESSGENKSSSGSAMPVSMRKGRHFHKKNVEIAQLQNQQEFDKHANTEKVARGRRVARNRNKNVSVAA